MDLISAKQAAAKESKTQKKPFYVIIDSEGEADLSSAPLKGAAHKFVNGAEDKTFEPKGVAPSPREDTKAVKEKLTKFTPTKTVGNMAKKPAKKAAAKKVAPKKPAAKKVAAAKPQGEGRKVDIAIKDMIAGHKKGFTYKDPQGAAFGIAYMENRKNKDHVRKGMTEFKPAA